MTRLFKRQTCKACETPVDRPGRSLYCSCCTETRTMYKSIVVNGRKTFSKKNKKNPIHLGMTRDELCRWRKTIGLKCFYCKIEQKELQFVGMKSQTQQKVKVLGIDRLDSSKGYEIDNIVPCCFVCNQVKSNRFTVQEMLIIGKTIGQIWSNRV